MFETIGLHSEWQGRIRNGVMFKTMDSQWWAHIQNNVLVLGMMGRVQNDGLALMMGLHSKQWAHIQNGGAVF